MCFKCKVNEENRTVLIKLSREAGHVNTCNNNNNKSPFVSGLITK